MADDEAPKTAADELAALGKQVASRPERGPSEDEVKARVAETRQMVLRELRTEGGDTAVADKLERGEKLEEADLVLVDAIIHGTGFLVDGKRVEPMRVKLIKWDAA